MSLRDITRCFARIFYSRLFFLSENSFPKKIPFRAQSAASQNEAEESDATEEEATREGEKDESGTTERWHEGRGKNRRETAK